MFYGSIAINLWFLLFSFSVYFYQLNTDGLKQGGQTFSVKGKIVHNLGFVGYKDSVPTA